ncbi:MBL fold metallo-hydrolase [Aquabacterium sp.]|uniref:MBL fold metallo-hydrolase n=1 Tax=Aquabacterium sp. TaxID=1872578 RepID=UPI0035B03E19
MVPQIEAFFDPATWTYSYVVFDQMGGHAVIIDPVLDYDPKSGRTTTRSADALCAFVAAQQLRVAWILETHAHADHLSAAHLLRSRLGARVAIGAAILQVQSVFKGIFNLGDEFAADGHHFDLLLADQDTLTVGGLTIRAWAVPGHTPADMAYEIGDALFVGDTLFMPDVGTARCDFPGGDASTLYRSIQRLLSFPDDTRLCMCHDYPPAGRAPMWCSTVAEQKAGNIHVGHGRDEAGFVSMRQARDATLDMPVLLLPAVQINIRAGQFPPPEPNGASYLKIPLNQL